MTDEYKSRRSYLNQRLRQLGYDPGMLQALWRDDPPPLPADERKQGAWFTECTLALLDALVNEGGITAWDGDGLSCTAQIVEAFAKRAR